MRTHETVSKKCSQFIAYEIARLNKEQAEQELRDLKKVTEKNQWSFVEYQLKPFLMKLLREHRLSLN
jgi:hypothetical protein